MDRELQWIEDALDKDFTPDGDNQAVVLPDVVVELEGILPFLPTNYDWGQIGFAASDRRGRFSKRISSYLYKQYGVKLDNETVTAIGNIAARHTASGDYIVRLDRELWEPGTFGDPESCFFQSRKAAPKLIFRNGGAAIKILRQDRAPVCRAWLSPRYDFAVTFNPYTVRNHRTFTTAQVAALLTAIRGPFAGKKTHSVDVVNYNNSRDTIWINNGTGTAITDASDSFDAVDLRIKVSDICARCGDVLDGLLYVHEGYTYCRECFPVRTCVYCGREAHRDYGSMHGDDFYCSACNDILTRPCIECQRQGNMLSMHYLSPGEWRCAYCQRMRQRVQRATRDVFATLSSNFNTVERIGWDAVLPQLRPQRMQTGYSWTNGNFTNTA